MSRPTDFGVASHTSLSDSLVAHSSLSPFHVRPTSRSDYRTCAIGLLGFYCFYRFYRYQAFGLLSFMLYPISDFRIYVVVYFGFMLLPVFAVWTLWYCIWSNIIIWSLLLFQYLLLCYFSHSYYFEKTGCYNFWYQSGVSSRLRPGMAIFGDSVLFGLNVLDDFKIFSWIWEFWKWK